MSKLASRAPLPGILRRVRQASGSEIATGAGILGGSHTGAPPHAMQMPNLVHSCTRHADALGSGASGGARSVTSLCQAQVRALFHAGGFLQMLARQVTARCIVMDAHPGINPSISTPAARCDHRPPGTERRRSSLTRRGTRGELERARLLCCGSADRGGGGSCDLPCDERGLRCRGDGWPQPHGVARPGAGGRGRPGAAAGRGSESWKRARPCRPRPNPDPPSTQRTHARAGMQTR